MRALRCLALWLVTAWICLGAIGPMTAQEAGEKAPTAESVKTELVSKSYDLDTVWTLLAGFLVMWMQAGFAAVETGFTRAKNAVHICMKNLLDFSFGTIAFWAIGFGLMFSIGNSFVGDSGFFLAEHEVKLPQEDGTVKTTTNFDPISWTNVPLNCKFFFQLVFAATAATIVSGAMAERTKFGAYLVYSIVITAFIYPISGHWIWGGGFLAADGFFDFAGSTVVHSVGGWMALCGALLVGPRLGKYAADGTVRAIPGHNIPFAVLGVFILWLGWFGFNPGSTMGAARADISHIVVTTNLAAAFGTVAALLTSKVLLRTWDAGMALNGALAGLVAITAPCAWVTAGSAALIGLAGGVLVVLSILFFDRIARIDDPVGAISVHGVCGALGTIAVGLFADPETVGIAGPKPGLFAGGGMAQLLIQLKGVGVVLLWCLATGLVLFTVLKFTLGIRVSKQEEIEGLDIGEHSYVAYHGFAMAAEPVYATAAEPRPATVPPDGKKRFTLVIDGVAPEKLASTWTELCQPTNGSVKDFTAIYPHFLTISGNRLRFRGGDAASIKASAEKLFQDRLRTPGVKVSVE